MTRPGEARFSPDFLTEMFRNPLDAGYAQTASRRAAGAPVRGAGLARAVRLLVLAATGFLLAVAYQQTVAAQPESAKVHQGLVADVKSRQAETDALQAQADALRDRVARARDAALAGRVPDLSGLEVATGLVKVEGDGAVVELGDAPRPVDPVTGQSSGNNLGAVLDQDLQDVSNELWRLGAAAIAINGERLTATTTIRTAGSTILVNFHPLASPYQVAAIGPADLDRRFADSATGKRFASYTARYGMHVSVRHRDGLVLPAGPVPQLHFAQPVPSDTPTPDAGGTPTPGARPSGATPSPSGGR